MIDGNPAYPMWVIVCEDCAVGVATLWERPGTGCCYVRRCPHCGGDAVDTARVQSNEEHSAAKRGDITVTA